VLKTIRGKGSEFSETEEQRKKREKEDSFSEVARELLEDRIGKEELDRKKIRQILEEEKE